MTSERESEIQQRLDDLPEGPWELGWDGQQFYLRDADGEEVMELTFAIPTWGERYEQAKAECDISIPLFLYHARQDIPALLAALTAERQAREAAERQYDTLSETYARVRASWLRAEQERDTARAALLSILTIDGLTDAMECDCWESAPCALHQFEIAAAHARAVLASAGEQPATEPDELVLPQPPVRYGVGVVVSSDPRPDLVIEDEQPATSSQEPDSVQ